MNQPLDLLVFAPHPDDAEIGLGGLIAKLSRQGKRVGIVDLTQGEWGTKGTPDVRRREANAASEILGLAIRENLELPDGRLEPSLPQRRAVAACIRRHRPAVLACVPPIDRHPDHRAAAALVRDAAMWARLPKAEVEGEPCFPRRLLYYFIHDVQPGYGVVDIGEDFETKLRAVRAYESQFVAPDLPMDYRYIGTSDYLRAVETRARHYGEQIGAAFGEAVGVDGPWRLDSPLDA